MQINRGCWGNISKRLTTPNCRIKIDDNKNHQKNQIRSTRNISATYQQTPSTSLPTITSNIFNKQPQRVSTLSAAEKPKEDLDVWANGGVR